MSNTNVFILIGLAVVIIVVIGLIGRKNGKEKGEGSSTVAFWGDSNGDGGGSSGSNGGGAAG